MPKFLTKVSLTKAGLAGVMKEGGVARAKYISELFESMGGKIESFNFAFGETDVYVVAEFPDHITGASVGLVVGASGAAKTDTVVLITPEELDAVVAKAPDFRAPGA